MSDIRVSIAVVTRNRPLWLQKCLASWRSQTIQPFEILVSDDSDDVIRPVNRDIAKRFAARWLAGPQRGLYANRNFVARQCSGTHVFSSDDDHEHPVDLLQKCTDAIRHDADGIWCLGEVMSREDLRGGWSCPGELRVRGAPQIPRDRSNTWAWSDGATVCPKRIFEGGLCFCEAFRFGWAYLEFGALLHSIGKRIRILDGTGVIHHANETGRSFQVPVEECAASYFALMMLANVYQPTSSNRALLGIYFLKQALRNPHLLCRAFPWAIREKRRRTCWFKEWKSRPH